MNKRIIAVILLFGQTFMSCYNPNENVPQTGKKKYTGKEIRQIYTSNSAQHEEKQLQKVQPNHLASTIIDSAIPLPTFKETLSNEHSNLFDFSKLKINSINSSATYPRSEKLPIHSKKVNTIKNINKRVFSLAAQQGLQASRHQAQAKRVNSSKKNTLVEQQETTSMTTDALTPIIPYRGLPLTIYNQQLTSAPLNILTAAFAFDRNRYQAPVQQDFSDIPTLSLTSHSLSTLPHPSVSIKSREGHQITFIQDAGYWWGIVNENCPSGFSRILTLPVYYLQGMQIASNQVGLIHTNTVEDLLKAPSAIQRQHIHVVLPEKDPQKKGFLQIVPVRGLLGGGRNDEVWERLGKGAIEVAVVLVPEVVIPVVLIVKFVNWLFGCLNDYLEQQRRAMERQKAVQKLNTSWYNISLADQQRLSIVYELLRKVAENSESYKNVDKYLMQIENYKNMILNNICKLQAFKNDPYLLNEDKKYIDNFIDSEEFRLKELEANKEKVKQLCRDQAWKVFEEKRESGEKVKSKYIENLQQGLEGMASNEGCGQAKANFKLAKTQLQKNKRMCEKWQKKPALFPKDWDTINHHIGSIDKELEELKLTEELIEYAEKSIKNARGIQDMTKSNPKIPLNQHAATAIKNDALCVLQYLIGKKGLLVNNIIDNIENTLLHKAVAANKPKIVEYLLRQTGIDTTIRNKARSRKSKGQTPLEIAKERKYKLIIELLEKNK